MEVSHEGQGIAEEMAEADRRSRELDRRMPEAEAAPSVLFYGPDVEIQVVEVVDMEMLRVFLAQYGEGHLTEDRAWQEQEHVDFNVAEWVGRERERISNNKFRTPNTTNILMDIPIYIPNKLITVPLEEVVEDQTIVLLALMQDLMILVEMQ